MDSHSVTRYYPYTTQASMGEPHRTQSGGNGPERRRTFRFNPLARDFVSRPEMVAHVAALLAGARGGSDAGSNTYSRSTRAATSSLPQSHAAAPGHAFPSSPVVSARRHQQTQGTGAAAGDDDQLTMLVSKLSLDLGTDSGEGATASAANPVSSSSSSSLSLAPPWQQTFEDSIREQILRNEAAGEAHRARHMGNFPPHPFPVEGEAGQQSRTSPGSGNGPWSGPVMYDPNHFPLPYSQYFSHPYYATLHSPPPRQTLPSTPSSDPSPPCNDNQGGAAAAAAPPPAWEQQQQQPPNYFQEPPPFHWQLPPLPVPPYDHPCSMRVPVPWQEQGQRGYFAGRSFDPPGDFRPVVPPFANGDVPPRRGGPPPSQHRRRGGGRGQQPRGRQINGNGNGHGNGATSSLGGDVDGSNCDSNRGRRQRTRTSADGAANADTNANAEGGGENDNSKKGKAKKNKGKGKRKGWYYPGGDCKGKGDKHGRDGKDNDDDGQQQQQCQ